MKVSVDAILQAFGDNKRDFERLAERVKLVHAILRSSPEDAPQEFKDRRDGLERCVQSLHASIFALTVVECNRSLNGLAEALKAKGDRTKLERVAHSKDDQQAIVRLVREVSFAIEIAMVGFSLWAYVYAALTQAHPPSSM